MANSVQPASSIRPAVYDSPIQQGNDLEGLQFSVQALNAAASVAAGVAGSLVPGLGGLGGGSSLNSEMAQMQKQNMEYLRLQSQIQHMSQRYNAESNVSKTVHESSMNTLRNVRA